MSDMQPRAGVVHPAMPETMFALGQRVLAPNQAAVLSTHNLTQLSLLTRVSIDRAVTLGMIQTVAGTLLELFPDAEVGAIWCDAEGVLRYWSHANPDTFDTWAKLQAIDAQLLRDSVEEVRREQADGGL